MKDQLARLSGVGDVNIIGARDYAMRIWLDPEKVAARGLDAGEVVSALQAENVQVSAGVLNQPPVTTPGAFQLSVETLGRLSTPEQFADIVIRTDPNGRITRVRDVARVELAAQDYNANGYLDTRTAVPMLIFQQPGSNALATAQRVRAAMATLSKDFPQDVAYDIVYDPTQFIDQSVNAVIHTIFEAVVLVVVVVILFLQTWRASVIPIVAIPISLIGTFAVLAAFGFSLNNLSLFGLVLAVGIVVDDAIVVVENVERNLRLGMLATRSRPPHDGRGRRRADRHRADTVRRVHPVGLHQWHLRPILPPVRRHHRRPPPCSPQSSPSRSARRCAPCCSNRMWTTRMPGGPDCSPGRSCCSSTASTRASIGCPTATAG